MIKYITSSSLIKASVFFVFLFVGNNLFAQKIKKFTPTKEAYSTELLEFLKEITKTKEQWEPLHIQFTSKLNSDVLSTAEFNALVEASNTMLRKRVVDFEPWQYMLKTIVLIHENEDEKYAEPFMIDFAEYAKKNTQRNITVYLRTVYQGLSEQTLFDDGGLRWQAKDAVWTFSFVGEAMFTIESADLWGYFKTDSTIIEGTNGIYYPQRYQFVGNGGTVYWVRTGLSQDSAYATLSNFTLSTEKTNYTADTVTLHSKLYVKEPLMGKFEERLSSRSEVDAANFPRFVSYNQEISLKDIYPNVSFIGGISVIGNKFYGSGNETQKASVFFNYEGKPVVRAQSKRFLLRQDVLSSDAAQVTISIAGDSIYHPKSALKFIVELNQLSLNRTTEGLSRTPYTDSYHNLDIYLEQVTWKLNEPRILLGNLNLGVESSLIFESQNYYRGERMDQIKGLDDKGPLRNIQKAAAIYGRNILSVEEMARGLQMSPEATHRLMLEMSILGFVSYDQANESITIKEKLNDYVLNERGIRDFDVIRFVSGVASGANAAISLLNFDMDIAGIRAIALSDSQEVALFPKGGKITVHEGLNFDFDGRITAGRFSFWGTKFYFDYNLFQMNMANIDSMRFKVESFEADAFGNRQLVDVKNVLENINGELLIDKPNNKSGKISYTEYPIFRSGKESYVYYDRPTTFEGVYERSRFFVTLEPFEIDSLDNTTTAGLKFAGTLNSGNIFPDIDEDIMVQKDYSLGFQTSTPGNGYATYGGKGNYKGAINLSNEGLQGDGEINYLTSTAFSNDLYFFLDSTNGTGRSYEIREQRGGVQYPHVTATNVKMNWRPYDDVFYTRSQTSPFNMYDDIGMKATGQLALSPSRLAGDATLDFLDAQSASKDYTFLNREFNSQQMAFKVRANPTAAWGFELKNSRGFVNFDKEKGEFTNNDPAGYLSFPINQYLAFMDFAEWQIPAKTIEVKKLGGGAKSHMVSVHPQQDSLQFNAGSAKFSLVPSLLEGYEIPYIEVADASIEPDTGYVAIDPGAAMRTLTKAAITANRTQKFHNFYQSTVNISSRKRYSASGYLDYLDEDGTPWPLFFATIKPDTALTTIANAKVTEEDGFFLSSFFAYYGNVTLTAPQKNLTFDGYTLIQHTCENINTTWFKFKSTIDPKQIVIDLPERSSLINGIFLAPDSTSGYSAFLARPNSKADQEIITATGILYYDKALYSYVVTTPEKLSNTSAPANYLTLNNKDCYTTGEGLLAFADKAGRIEIGSYGVVKHNMAKDEMSMDIVLGFEFYFDEDIMKGIAKKLRSNTDLKGTNINRKAYTLALDHLLTGRDRQRFDEEVSNFGAPERIPRSMRKTISFSEINLEFNKETGSFLSTGPIGIGSILDEPVNKQVEGTVEIIRKRRGDEITIYFEVAGGDIYFFQYKRNLMQFYTSDKEMMLKFMEIDSKKRSLPAKDGLPAYNYNASTKGKVNLFLNRFEE